MVFFAFTACELRVCLSVMDSIRCWVQWIIHRTLSWPSYVGPLN